MIHIYPECEGGPHQNPANHGRNLGTFGDPMIILDTLGETKLDVEDPWENPRKISLMVDFPHRTLG